nr:hypothetical protein [Chloroflexia bacterium]
YQPGAVVITETIPEGYGTPGVYCSFDLGDSAPVGNDISVLGGIQIMDVSPDGSISTQVGANQHYVCHWFNFPSSDYDIVIYTYVCPAGYAPAAFDYGPLLADCTGETRDGVVFHVGDQTQATGEAIPGGVAFDGYEPGDLIIREEVPAGYTPYVFCGQSSGGVAFDQMTPVPMLLTLAEDGSITVNLSENSRLICYWYNVLTETAVPGANLDVVDEVDEEEEPGSNRGLTIQHFACDPGLDPRLNQGRYTLLQLCTGAAKPAFAYHIYVDQTLIETVGLQTAANTWGEVFLPAPQQEPIPAGLVTITVEPPAGYAGAKVNCLQSRTDDSSEEIEPNLINDTSIMVNVGPGESLVCEWFNAPVEPGIDISAWLCPAGYDATDVTLVPYAVLLQDCAQPHDGVEFSLGIPMGAYSFGFTGEDGPGHLRFEDYNPGIMVITETIPEGYGTPRAFCTYGPFDPSSGLVHIGDSGDGSISPDGPVPENSHLVCHFFNFPQDELTGAIDMFRFECPSGFTPDLSAVNDAISMCAEPLGGVNFEVSNEEGVVGGGATDAGGYLSIRELPLGGRLSIADVDTDGYDSSTEDVDDLPYVFCFDDSVVHYPGPGLDSVRGAYSQQFIVEGEFMTVEIDLNNVSNYSSRLWFSIAGD